MLYDDVIQVHHQNEGYKAMQNPINQTQIIEDCLGHSRHHCLLTLSSAGIESLDFGHWLAIPSQQLLLVFRHQQCVVIDGYQQAA